MADIIDIIKGKLSPEAIATLSSDIGSVYEDENAKILSDALQSSLRKVEEIQLDRYIRELEIDSNLLNSKISDKRRKLEKYRDELTIIKNQMETQPKIAVTIKERDTYLLKATKLEAQVKSLLKGTTDLKPAQLFTNINNLAKEVVENERQIKELEDKFEKFSGLPPNLSEAKQCVEERRQEVEAILLERENLLK